MAVRDWTMRGTRLALLALVLASCGRLGERRDGQGWGEQGRKKAGAGVCVWGVPALSGSVG